MHVDHFVIYARVTFSKFRELKLLYTAYLLCRISIQLDGEEGQAMLDALRAHGNVNGNMMQVTRAYSFVTSACYCLHHLLLCDEAETRDPR